MREIARLRDKAFPEQINTPVTVELKDRFTRLKKTHRIDTAAEIRKVLERLAMDLESACDETAATG